MDIENEQKAQLNKIKVMHDIEVASSLMIAKACQAPLTVAVLSVDML